ncbi:LysR family transcriptional regulator [Rhodoferax sp.]|uniref:LysR family transcriptional regulator n=1 Tax=Rhodoferax sp. TaxID=50421 RepID=UPI0025CE9102|nr:LysR family transcriptional regulator [Rhodoferax sp.]MCM2296685.1 LysR family transcriptional regulator [Rhodoferax sp.]
MDTNQTDANLLDVKHLRLFDLLYSTHSVTRCSELLGQCQPTVSIWLSKLRKELGDPLFIRTADGMQATPRADELIVSVRAALDALRQLTVPEPAFDPAQSHRHFRICMTDASHITLLPQLLAHVRALAPGTTLEAAHIDEKSAEALQSGEADLAIGLVPWLESGFYQQTLFPQDWVCLVNPRHPRIGETLDTPAYQKEGHIEIVSGTGSGLLKAALEQHHIRRKIVLALPGFLGLATVVASTDLVATLPRHIGETLAQINGLRVFTCPVAIPGFTVKQHWHARFHNDAGNLWLRGVCASLFMDRKVRGAATKDKLP